MTYPWAAGEVLTAADLNSAMGLVLVKSQTIGSGVSSVTVTGAFSSTFDNYRITINGLGNLDSGDITFALSGATTSYYGTMFYDSYTGTPSAAVRISNGSSLSVCTAATSGNAVTFDVVEPNIARFTFIHGQAYSRGFYNHFGGFHAATTAYTGFVIAPTASTMTGGTIRVYGYNNG